MVFVIINKKAQKPSRHATPGFTQFRIAVAEWFKQEENLTTNTSHLRCLVGSDHWLIETDQENAKNTWWFTGTNLIRRVVTTGYASKHKELDEAEPCVAAKGRFTRPWPSARRPAAVTGLRP